MRSRGFTLVEVLAALVIVALGMGAVLATLGSSASTVAYLREKTLAQWIALNRIATTRLSGALPGVGTSNGTIVYAGTRWRWRQKVSTAHVPGLYRIDVSVRRAHASTHAKTDWLASETGVVGNTLAPPDMRSVYLEYSAARAKAGAPTSLGGP